MARLGQHRIVLISIRRYYEVPIEVLEDVDLLQRWAEKAIAVARGAKQRKRRA